MTTQLVPKLLDRARDEFRSRFGGEPRVFRAPGRVNLIGGHLDYNEGWVLPIAIDRSCYVLAQRRKDHILRIHSAHFNETLEFCPDDVRPSSIHWSSYARGVAWSLAHEVPALPGADLLIDSEVPPGSGLSSSAALEVAVGFALLGLAESTMDPTALALACQRAENEYVGMRCGIMDQLVACLGHRGCALLIDCRTLAVEQLPIDETRIRVVVANTMVKHALASSEYNVRRRECEDAATSVRKSHPTVRTLRDISWPEIETESNSWPDAIRRRARHVTTEISRVHAAVRALRSSDFESLGHLMSQSHDSLDADYQVTSAELNMMVAIARGLLGMLGARMTGGGFGGCTVNLVRAEHDESFASELARRYEAETRLRPDVYICRASDGVCELDFSKRSEQSAGGSPAQRSIP